MSADVIPFPQRKPSDKRKPAVQIEDGDDGFLVVYRKHTWLHTSFADALDEARELAGGYGVSVFYHDHQIIGVRHEFIA